MRNIIFVCLLVFAFTTTYAANIINPLDFTPTEANKAQVIAYIETVVKKTYSEIGMDDPATLRMMENEHLKAFKELTSAKNRDLLDSVIETYCNIGMCDYHTINMMYNEQLKASAKKLDW